MPTGESRTGGVGAGWAVRRLHGPQGPRVTLSLPDEGCRPLPPHPQCASPVGGNSAAVAAVAAGVGTSRDRSLTAARGSRQQIRDGF
jgi:hypothetical protein